VPPERLDRVARQYERFGGVSPINQHNRDLVAALQDRLDVPVYWGNRNWRPFLADTVRQMADDGVAHALAFVTSAYSSYSSCRQYLEDIARARAEVGDGAPIIEKIRPFFDHPDFAGCFRDALDGLEALPEEPGRLVFTAHSIPVAMADQCRYQEQLRHVAAAVAGPDREWDLAYQSRSGPPSVPWLEPDVGDHLEGLAGRGVRAATVVPIGFVSDHMEVVYDLDVIAAQRAAAAGIAMQRVPTPGASPRFVKMVSELITEHAERGGLPPDFCYDGCCPPR